jgi:hypothetical protein
VFKATILPQMMRFGRRKAPVFFGFFPIFPVGDIQICVDSPLKSKASVRVADGSRALLHSNVKRREFRR